MAIAACTFRIVPPVKKEVVLTTACEEEKVYAFSLHISHRQRKLCAITIVELYLNRRVKPYGPIRRIYTKIGGCHLALFRVIFLQGGGLDSEYS